MKNLLARVKHLYADHQFVRFVLIGIANTIFSYLVYATLIFVGVNFALANLGALALGVIFSFGTQSVLVFKNTDSRLFFKYVLLWLVIYLCNVGLIKLLLDSGLNAYTAGAVAAPPVILLSYLLQKYAIFGRRPIAGR